MSKQAAGARRRHGRRRRVSRARNMCVRWCGIVLPCCLLPKRCWCRGRVKIATAPILPGFFMERMVRERRERRLVVMREVEVGVVELRFIWRICVGRSRCVRIVVRRIMSVRGRRRRKRRQ